MGRFDELLWQFGPERFRTAFVRNLGHPRGLLGRRVGASLVVANAGINTLVVERLALQHDEVVLEVGHGPGAAFAQVLAAGAGITAIGADPSTEMVRAARTRNAEAVDAGRVVLHHARSEDLPLATASVDAAFGNNVLYFWRDPALALGELRRVLRPAGRLALGYRPRDTARADLRERFDRAGHQLYGVEQVEAMLLAAGFRTPVTTLADTGEAVTLATSPPNPTVNGPSSDGAAVSDPAPDLELPTFVVE